MVEIIARPSVSVMIYMIELWFFTYEFHFQIALAMTTTSL